MTKLAWFFPLLCAASAATASPGPTPAPLPPPPPLAHGPVAACPVRGAVLFEADHRPQIGLASVTSTLVVFESGAWTLEAADATGRVTRAASGCLDATTLAAIRNDLSAATWTITQAQAMCEVASDSYDLYLVRGKAVWTQEMCQLATLDAASEHALDDVRARLAAATAEVKPPCCKK